jgi:FMN-dependent oxidoreductase (nitrilotriacetate monooxygenase family)
MSAPQNSSGGEDKAHTESKMPKMFHMAHFSRAGSHQKADDRQKTSEGYDWRYPELYQDIARTAERGKFDLVFFADAIGMPRVYKNGAYHATHGVMMPRHDPLPLMAVMAAATSRVGLVPTVSTSFYPPFLAARVLATLDHLSRGRMGWNVVTSAEQSAAQNMGLDELVAHDKRYDIADEYLDLCRKLWDSWEPDALVLDREAGVMADPAKIHSIDFEGKYFKSRGPLTVSSSPQGHPVIISAGSSPRGMQFAAENVEMTIIEKSNIDEIKDFTSTLRGQVAAAGRDPRSCKIFKIIRPFIGETDAIAQALHQSYLDKMTPENILAIMSENLGIDLSQMDLDKPLPAEAFETNTHPYTFRKYYENGKNPPLREVALDVSRNFWISTPGSPETIVDKMQEISEEGDVDGFLLEISLTDYSTLVQFVDQVVPVAQRRGLMRKDYTGTTLRHHLTEF